MDEARLAQIEVDYVQDEWPDLRAPKSALKCLFAVPSLCAALRAAWKELDDLRSQYKTALLVVKEARQERDKSRRALNAERKLMLAKYDELQAKLDAAHEQIGYYRKMVGAPSTD